MTPTDETRALVDAINALVETGTEEIERLRARVAEMERDARLGEEREQSDDALLRQALEALERGAWDTLSGRNAAFAIRERLGLAQEDRND